MRFARLGCVVGVLGVVGCAGSDGAQGPPGPTMPVIQSIAVEGSPTNPLGWVTARVSAQSAEGLALTYAWSVTPASEQGGAGWYILPAASAGTTVTVYAPGVHDATGTVTVTVTDSAGRLATGMASVATDSNRPPVLEYFAAAPPTLARGEVTLLQARALDPDDPDLTYTWALPPGFEITSAPADPRFGRIEVRAPTYFVAGDFASVHVEDPHGGSTGGLVFLTVEDGAWTAPDLVEQEDLLDAANPQVALAVSGDVVAVWERREGSRADVWANRFDALAGWEAAQAIEPDVVGSAYAPQVAMLNARGEALAVWAQASGGRTDVAANLFTKGVGWGGPVLVNTTTAGDARPPALASDGAGTAIVVWTQSDGVHDHVWARHWSDSGWSDPELLETDAVADARDARVAMDSRGNALVLWQQSDGAADSTWARHFVAATGWADSEQVGTSELGSLSQPQVAIGAGGDCAAVWVKSDGVTKRVWRAVCAAAPAGWNPPAPYTVEDSDSPQVGIDAEGTIFVAYRSGDDGPPRLGVNAGSAWNGSYPTSSGGDSIVVWSGSDGVRSRIWANRTIPGTYRVFRDIIEPAQAEARAPAVALDARGNAAVVWEQQAAGGRTDIWCAQFR